MGGSGQAALQAEAAPRWLDSGREQRGCPSRDAGLADLMGTVHPYEAGYEQMVTVWYATIEAYLH